MYKNRGFRVDFSKNTIFISKEFAKNVANTAGTEYQSLIQLQQAFPKFSVKPMTVSKEKENHKGLKIAFMRRYIKSQVESQNILDEFEQTITEYVGHPYYYGKVKSKFLQLCPDYLEVLGRKKAKNVDDAEAIDNVEEIPNLPKASGL